MIIDSKTFTELAVHLRIASDAIVRTAHHMHAIGTPDQGPGEDDAAWNGTIDSMMSLSDQIQLMDRLLYAVLNANQEEVASGSPGDPQPC